MKKYYCDLCDKEIITKTGDEYINRFVCHKDFGVCNECSLIINKIQDEYNLKIFDLYTEIFLNYFPNCKTKIKQN